MLFTALKSALAGNSSLGHPVVRTLVYVIPLALSSGVCFYVMVMLERSSCFVDEYAAPLMFQFALVFAVVNLLAYPIFTQDFWLSIAWGRMSLYGQNPYYELLTPEALAGLPLLDFPIRMTYGPLWVMLSAGLAFVSQENVLVEFVVFKLALAAFWIASLGVIYKIVALSPPAFRAKAMCLFGWLPVSVHMSIGEGHNDIAMIWLCMLWLYVLLRNPETLCPLPLVASALVKYVTAPLIVVALVHRVMTRRSLYFWEALGGLLCVLLVGVAFAPFWRDAELFSAVAKMRSWEFFTPTHAIGALSNWLNIAVPAMMVTAFISIAVMLSLGYYGFMYCTQPRFSRLVELILAILCGVLFVGVGHVWPWFIIWIVAPAALVMESALLRLVIPVAFLGPFLHAYWLLATGWGEVAVGSVLFYFAVAVWIVLIPASPIKTNLDLQRFKLFWRNVAG
jgi:hypothetical protein